MEQKEMFISKTKHYIKEYLLIAVLVSLCLIYIIKALIDIKPNEEFDLVETLKAMLLPVLMGFMISSILIKQAVIDGRKSEKFIKTLNTYGEMVVMTDRNYEKLDLYCNMENKHRLENKQKEYLRVQGVSYEKFKNGTLDFSILTKKEIKAVKKANKIKVFLLTPQYLMNECEYDKDDIKVVSIAKKETRQDLSGIFSKVVLSFVFAIYTIEALENFSYQGLIWSSLQIVLWLGMGVLNYAKMYEYVTEEYRTTSVIRKINYLTKFNNLVEKNLIEEEKKEEETVKKEEVETNGEQIQNGVIELPESI